MPKIFNARVMTQEKLIFEGSALSLVVPSELGYLGVLADHASLIANLVAGKVSITKESGDRVTIFSKGKGIFEVSNNKAIILLDSV
jgi:F-type H+-transporting ATPase subunit epsilon